jgi:ABC-type multidrug transport system ATPase subunit
MTTLEFLQFHQSFKPFLPNISITEIIALVQLEHAAHKQIRYFSSGMKQRLKLAQCIFSNVDYILLDEPCTNLDQRGATLYHHLIKEYTQNRCIIVSSNDPNEYGFCNEVMDILQFK